MARWSCLILATLVIVASAPTVAQDVRGLEVCTAEKAMDRRTSCLQSNVEFLHQTLTKQGRDLQAKLDALSREATAQKVELAALRTELAKVQAELAEIKKAKPAQK